MSNDCSSSLVSRRETAVFAGFSLAPGITSCLVVGGQGLNTLKSTSFGQGRADRRDPWERGCAQISFLGVFRQAFPKTPLPPLAGNQMDNRADSIFIAQYSVDNTSLDRGLGKQNEVGMKLKGYKI